MKDSQNKLSLLKKCRNKDRIIENPEVYLSLNVLKQAVLDIMTFHSQDKACLTRLSRIELDIIDDTPHWIDNIKDTSCLSLSFWSEFINKSPESTSKCLKERIVEKKTRRSLENL